MPTNSNKIFIETKEALEGKTTMRQFLKFICSFKNFAAFMEFSRKTISEKGFVLLSSVVVGVISGFAAVLLKSFCDFCHELSIKFSGGWEAWLLPALPALGIMLCVVYVKIFVKGRYEKSLSSVIAATASGRSDLPPMKMFTHIITSGLCVGLGGSAGLEAPIALTGSAIGSNTAKTIGLGSEGRTLLLACGGAGGIAAIFNSPVGGTLFACEVLLPEFSVPALVPLLMSAAAASVVSSILYSNHPFITLSEGWRLEALPFYVALGIFCGIVSAYVIRTTHKVGETLHKTDSLWRKAIIGSLLLYVAFLTMPALRGEGYNLISDIVAGNYWKVSQGGPYADFFSTGWAFALMIAVLIFMKTLVSVITIDCGGDGGIFAPSMFTGAFTGLLLSRMVNMTGIITINEVNFIAVGMGGLLSGVMHAPMTGIFLIAEITGGYKLFIPLMIASSLACFVSKRIEKHNVYKKTLVSNGFNLEPNPDVMALETATVGGLVEHDLASVKQTDTLRNLIRIVMSSKRNVFPVLDDSGALVGIVTLGNLRPFLLDSHLYDIILVYDLMSPSGPTLDAIDSLATATRLFDKCGAWNLPVVEKGKYLGFVSKSGVFDKYRELLRNKPELF